MTLGGSSTPGRSVLGVIFISVTLVASTASGARLNRFVFFDAHAAGTLTPTTETTGMAAFYNPAGLAFQGWENYVAEGVLGARWGSEEVLQAIR